ncbi:hypothetical protein AB6A40_008765 [Gnathostoma spinigerum]|uniref:Ubiquitin-like domain-containing protein n=1 Tax=Gnathostoma spinigerum TaxID=75299 RepID=A0ABD6EQE0_9BILA
MFRWSHSVGCHRTCVAMTEDSTEVEETVDLLIRCALQSFDDTPVKCPLNWTVRQLKDHLSVVCATKPDAKRQRLIYSGHCLQDERTLRSLFELRPTEDDVRVIHLVCPPKDFSEFNTLRKRNIKTSKTPCATSSSQHSTSAQNNNTALPNQMNMPWSNFVAHGNYAVPYPFQYESQYQSAYSAYMTSYANYMQQYMLAMNSAANTPVSASVSFPLNNQRVVVPHLRPPMAQEHHPQVAAQPVAAVAPNAQPAPAAGGIVQEAMGGEVDPAPRDFLDVVYKAIRMCFLIMLVYVYSSAERFIGVSLFILAVWFLQARRDRNERQRDEREVEEAVDVVRQVPRRDGGVEEVAENVTDVQNDSEINRRGSATEPRDPTAWTVFWSTCYTFITSFFTSLIPENPVPVNVN